MCNKACIDFVTNNISFAEVGGENVIEVGSLNVNGSVSSVIESMRLEQNKVEAAEM